MNIELISWTDSIRHADGWQSLDHYVRESERSMECETVGFVVNERDDSVMLAQSRMVGEGGAITEVIQIPKLAIRHRFELQQRDDTPKRARSTVDGKP